jgi:hypothetical protein
MHKFWSLCPAPREGGEAPTRPGKGTAPGFLSFLLVGQSGCFSTDPLAIPSLASAEPPLCTGTFLLPCSSVPRRFTALVVFLRYRLWSRWGHALRETELQPQHGAFRAAGAASPPSKPDGRQSGLGENPISGILIWLPARLCGTPAVPRTPRGAPLRR